MTQNLAHKSIHVACLHCVAYDDPSRVDTVVRSNVIHNLLHEQCVSIPVHGFHPYIP